MKNEIGLPTREKVRRTSAAICHGYVSHSFTDMPRSGIANIGFRPSEICFYSAVPRSERRVCRCCYSIDLFNTYDNATDGGGVVFLVVVVGLRELWAISSRFYDQA